MVFLICTETLGHPITLPSPPARCHFRLNSLFYPGSTRHMVSYQHSKLLCQKSSLILWKHRKWGKNKTSNHQKSEAFDILASFVHAS
ncbi:hypothetical protein NE237_005553 [Protea cynaroides]|uniref:Uncharacterized protein n=1 Tax=Protea cynaroides TaxID=273540 RepID=A0A9Q0GN57_9MAGN|nr:hypothetical protein NE237_005553 [Protea cynaroides]